TRNGETDSVNGFLNAQLFPDLSANLNLNWSRSENPQEDTESENYGWRLNSTARLTPRINANAYYDYSASKSEGVDADADADDDATRYGLGLNFRTSDILLFYASLSRNVDEKTTAFTGSASWRVTPKIQTSFSTSQALEQGDSESYSANVSWLVSSHLSLRSSADYHVVDGDEVWSWRLNINATF
ncbi:MAG: autotransporter outer membrane beta-barrel domain-containing protein, partial [Desulfuromonadales bacterium]|nr:autotransporter outer membrane beta-barrel domain-containing protein [Desulfuromonadales bacterium]